MIRKYNLKTFFVLLLLFIVVFFSCSSEKINDLVILNKIPKILFVGPPTLSNISVGDSNNVASLKNSLMTAGLKITEVITSNLADQNLSEFDIVIVPCASAQKLTDILTKSLVDAVNNGLFLFTDGESPLAEKLGVKKLPKTISVSKVREHNFSRQILYWTKDCKLFPIDTTKSTYSVLATDSASGSVLSVFNKFGKGSFIYFAPLFDPITSKGYSRFPFLLESFYHFWGFKPIAERVAVEVYFDSGNRPEEINIDSLTQNWRKQKIKRVFASGWYYDEEYDYKHLIKACHENGILIYCWLETPLVTRQFWEKHPEWREKTAFLKDAIIDWRHLMNMANADCRKQTFIETSALLMNYDWDGVNFAEMYFEPTDGIELSQNFTPMNQDVRDEYKALSGFDPILFFDKNSSHFWRKNSTELRAFLDYRKDLCYRIKKTFIEFLLTIKAKKQDFEVMLTVIDVSLTPAVSDNIAEVTENSIKLQKEYGITLQEEDPSNSWGSTPDRYQRLGELYRKSIKEEQKLVFDCNVVSAHQQGFGGFPCEFPAGEEIRQIAYNMDLHQVRPAFYSEDAILPSDFLNISSVLARKTVISQVSHNKWNITTPYTVILNYGEENLDMELNEKHWLAGENGTVIIPKGTHQLEFINSISSTNFFKIVSISGELIDTDFSPNKINLTYSEAESACYLGVNLKPKSIKIDEKEMKCNTFQANNFFTIKLPKGLHKVEITAESNSK